MVEGVAIVNIVLVVILAAGLISGLVKGLIRQVIELAGIIGSFFIAVLFAGWLADLLQEHVSLPYSPSLVVAFIVLFVAGLIGFHFVAMSVQKLVHMTFLGWVDRMCGGMLGLIVGLLFASVLVTVVLELPVPNEVRQPVQNAEMALFVEPIAPRLFDFVFSHVKDGYDFRSVFKGGGPV
jgi:membrane protein required for colicin V production